MRTLFESNMDMRQPEFFSKRVRAKVIDWIALDSEKAFDGFFIKKYEIETETMGKTDMQLKIHRITPYQFKVEVYCLLYINDDTATSFTKPDLQRVEEGIAWNEWLDLPPELIADMMKEVSAWYEEEKDRVGFFR